MEKITTFIAYWLAVALAYLGAISPEKMALYVSGGCAIFTALTNYWFKRKTYLYSDELPDVVRRLHTRAGCASAGHCLQCLPEGELLPDAGKRSGR